MTPLWGLSRPNTVTYKVLDCDPRAHLWLPLDRNWLTQEKEQKWSVYVREKLPQVFTLPTIKSLLLLLLLPMPSRSGVTSGDSRQALVIPF